MKVRIRKWMAWILVFMLLSADLAVFAEEIAAPGESVAPVALATLTLPASLQVIEEEAFYGNTSIQKVVVPEGTTEIQDKAFADSSLVAIDLPESLKSISEDAFDGCGER